MIDMRFPELVVQQKRGTPLKETYPCSRKVSADENSII
jgi:hypothetical protein